jgi:alcohol dehydrogenase
MWSLPCLCYVYARSKTREVLIMKSFTYYNPTKVFVGSDVLESVGTTIQEKARKVLLLTGKGSVHKTGVYQKVLDILRQNDIHWITYEGIQSNPLLQDVQAAIDVAKKEDVDAVLAIGGGSVIDSAKAVAAGFFCSGNVWDFFHRTKTIKNSLPIYCVLTISGTASEMNGTAVITKQETNEKLSIKSELLFPRATWIDPTYQSSIPANQLSYTAMDIMSHVFEYYFAGYHTYFVDSVSESIMKTIMYAVPLLQANPTNLDARSEFAWAASWALNGFTSCGRGYGDFSSHRIGHAISAMYGIAHGQTLAIVQPAWMRYCYTCDIKKFSRFGRELFGLQGNDETVASDGIFRFIDWVHSVLGLTTSLSDLGIRAEDIKKIAMNDSIPYPLGTLKRLNQEDVVHVLRLSNY